jgi:hypothetical protein
MTSERIEVGIEACRFYEQMVVKKTATDGVAKKEDGVHPPPPSPIAKNSHVESPQPHVVVPTVINCKTEKLSLSPQPLSPGPITGSLPPLTSGGIVQFKPSRKSFDRSYRVGKLLGECILKRFKVHGGKNSNY